MAELLHVVRVPQHVGHRGRWQMEMEVQGLVVRLRLSLTHSEGGVQCKQRRASNEVVNHTSTLRMGESELAHSVTCDSAVQDQQVSGTTHVQQAPFKWSDRTNTLGLACV